MRLSLISLDEQLKREGKSFKDLRPKDQKEAATSAVDTALAPYRGRPSLIVLTFGLGAVSSVFSVVCRGQRCLREALPERRSLYFG